MTNPGKTGLVKRAIVLISIVAALAGLTQLLHSDFERDHEREGWVTHTYQVLNVIHSEMSSLEASGSAERGYLLTGDERYLAQFESALQSERTERQSVRQLTADNPRQQQRLQVFGRLIESRLALLRTAAAALREGGDLSGAVDIVRGGKANDFMDEARRLADEVEKEEQQLLQVRTLATDRQDTRMRWILGAGSTVLLLMLVLAGGVIERDIQRRQEAAESLREKARLLDLSYDAILVRDKEGRIAFWNKGAIEAYGYSSEEALGRSPHELLQTEFPEKLETVLSAVRQEGHWTGELVHTRKDGTKIIVSSRWVLDRDGHGNVSSILETNSDITERKKAERALRESENRFRTVIEQASDAFFLHDAEGRFLEVNRQACESLGYTREELLRMRVFDVEEEIEVGLARKLWEQAAPGEAFTLQGHQKHKNGTRFPVEIRLSACYIGGEKLHLGVVRDITERKRAEEAIAESERRYRGLFESMQEAFLLGEMIFDKAGQPCDWRYLDVNPYFEAIYGLKREDVVGKSYRDVFPGSHSDHWIEIAGRVTLTGKGEGFASRSNTGLYLEGTVYRPQPGQFAAIVTDATARRQAEEQIRRLNSELEDRVRDRTAQLEAANKELEAFAYSVSHDLRAPLRGIDGWSLALLEDYSDQLDSRAHEYLDRVRSESQRMGSLIDDLLELSRINKKELRAIPIDMSALAQSVATRLMDENSARKIDFAIQPELVDVGDPVLMDVALTNLFGNAVKFTRTRSEAHIEFGRLESNGERPFYVKDNGVGFDMAYADMLFGAFQRLHKATEFPGTGIGLATVQRVIRRHGGRVWGEAQRNCGATFYFTLGHAAFAADQAFSNYAWIRPRVPFS